MAAGKQAGRRRGQQAGYGVFAAGGKGYAGAGYGIIADCFHETSALRAFPTMAQTLYDKLWDSHVVDTGDDGTTLLYIDRHLLHEVTSPQAFEGLRLAGRQPWRRSANLMVADHNVPTTDRTEGISDPISRLQVETLDQNASTYNLTYFNMRDRRQGIVHVIGPE